MPVTFVYLMLVRTPALLPQLPLKQLKESRIVF